jgi:two-component system, cell cycle sensor histidine kinase and response regulator CckA
MPSLERIMAVNHHLRTALDQVSDAVIVVESGPLQSPGPRIVYANEAMAEATGVAAASLTKVPLGALSDEKHLPRLFACMAGAGAGGLEINGPLNHIKGQTTPCVWSAVPVTDGSGATLNYILTARPDAASTNRSSSSPAAGEGPPPSPDEYQQDLVETIRDTARYVAHEFNNALTAILLPVQIAIRQVPDGGDLHGKLQVAYESARRAADLAKDFLDCFRPRPAMRERCNMESLLGRAMRLATCAQNVNWSLEMDPELFDAEVDSNQIERVVFNLVRNACQAMPGGGKLLVKATNAIVNAAEGHDLKPGNYVHISVRDWGPGIPEEHMPHLFHSCFTTKDNGNGCGLPICHQIIRDHGGDIYVKSRPHVGTAFLIFLPACGTAASVAPAPAPAAPASVTPRPATVALPPLVAAPLPPAPPTPATGSVPVASLTPPPDTNARPVPAAGSAAVPEGSPSMLVVDDEDGVRRAISQIGQAYGFEVITAATSEEGLASYRDRLNARRRYDTVLLDLNLRGSLNGVDVFNAIRRIDPEATVIATSGQYTDADLDRFAQLGFAGFLPKPFTLEDFDQIVGEILTPQ